MRARKIEAEIRNFRDLLLANKLAIVGNPLVIRNIGHIKRVTWQSSITTETPSTKLAFASLREYSHQLAANAFTTILFDGSVIQLSVDTLRDEIVGHRFCFFPCPFDLQAEDLLQLPLLDLVKLHEEAGLEHLRLRSPMRFEYDPRNASENHPVCHVHFLWSHCRCSVVAPISLGHFIKFIFSHFYPQVWQKHSFLRDWPTAMGTRTISAAQENHLHLACSR
jgi:hypothetical protein